MKLLTINVGLPREVEWQGKRVSTGIFKSPVKGPIRVGKTNLAGDGQADLTVHGGEDKAVYGFARDAYPWWLKELGVRDLPDGAFGENLTFDTLDEAALCVSDRFRLGGCELQVVQPRFPCFKLGIKFNDMAILKTFIASGRPGIYFRVLEEGTITEGDELVLIEKDPVGVSIRQFFDMKIAKFADKAAVKKLLSVKHLNEEWREILQRAAST